MPRLYSDRRLSSMAEPRRFIFEHVPVVLYYVDVVFGMTYFIIFHFFPTFRKPPSPYTVVLLSSAPLPPPPNIYCDMVGRLIRISAYMFSLISYSNKKCIRWSKKLLITTYSLNAYFYSKQYIY